MDYEKLVELIKRVQNGDEKALETLYFEHVKRVYYLALKITGNKEDAEDIAQEVFVTVWTKISDLKEPKTFPMWLTRITTNKCTDFFRKKGSLTQVDMEDVDISDFEEANPTLIPDISLDNAETARIITEIIDALPDAQRVCVYFYYFEQMALAEIAEALAINKNTVKKRLQHARNKIRKELERLDKEEGIKLYSVIPFILTPILAQEMQSLEMPQELLNRVFENTLSSLNVGAAGAAKAAAGTTEAAAKARTAAGTTEAAVKARTAAGTTEGTTAKTRTAATTTTITATTAATIPATAGSTAKAGVISAGTKVLIASVAGLILVVGGIIAVLVFNGSRETASESSSLANTATATNQPETTATPQTATATPNTATAPPDTTSAPPETVQQPSPTPSDTDIYRTDFPDGFHTFSYGRWTYEGYWEDGMPNGAGKMYHTEPFGEFNTVNMYEGNFVDGLIHGSVVFTITQDDPFGIDGRAVLPTLPVSDLNMGVPENRLVYNDVLGIMMEWLSEDTILGMVPWGYWGG